MVQSVIRLHHSQGHIEIAGGFHSDGVSLWSKDG